MFKNFLVPHEFFYFTSDSNRQIKIYFNNSLFPFYGYTVCFVVQFYQYSVPSPVPLPFPNPRANTSYSQSSSQFSLTTLTLILAIQLINTALWVRWMRVSCEDWLCFDLLLLPQSTKRENSTHNHWFLITKTQ